MPENANINLKPQRERSMPMIHTAPTQTPVTKARISCGINKASVYFVFSNGFFFPAHFSFSGNAGIGLAFSNNLLCREATYELKLSIVR